MSEEIRELVALIVKAKRIAPEADLESAADNDEVRARAVSDVLGPEAIDGRCREYLAGVFDALLAAPEPEVQRMRAGQRRHH